MSDTMDAAWTTLTARLQELWPTPASVATGLCVGLVTFACAIAGVGQLHRRGWRVGDTRKVFHLAIFLTAVAVRALTSIRELLAFGVAVTCGVLWTVWRGAGNAGYEALARPTDAPRRTLHILVPLCCTAVGGMLSHLIAGRAAIVALLVGGLGDAVGEPVGIRWGRHQYVVPTLGGIPSRRSWEGTAAVFVMSLLACVMGLPLCGFAWHQLWWPALVLAVLSAGVEAVSPHGADNLTLPLAVSLVVIWF